MEIDDSIRQIDDYISILINENNPAAKRENARKALNTIRSGSQRANIESNLGDKVNLLDSPIVSEGRAERDPKISPDSQLDLLNGKVDTLSNNISKLTESVESISHRVLSLENSDMSVGGKRRRSIKRKGKKGRKSFKKSRKSKRRNRRTRRH